MNSDILKLEVKGEISIWKYIEGTPEYKGWQIYICPEAQKSISSLLKLMTIDEYASKKAINLSPPKEEITGHNNNYSGLAPYRYKRILFINSKKNLDTFSINENEMIVEFILDDASLVAFADTITTNSKGQKNFLLDNINKDHMLTFW
jgi:hypothetical protein